MIPISSSSALAPMAALLRCWAVNHTGEDELLQELVKQRVSMGGNEEPLKDPAVQPWTFLDNRPTHD